MSTPFPLLPGSLTDFDTVTAAIFVVMALSPGRALEMLALNDSSNADTVLGTTTGDPVLAFLQKPGEGESCFGETAFSPAEGLSAAFNSTESINHRCKNHKTCTWGWRWGPGRAPVHSPL